MVNTSQDINLLEFHRSGVSNI